MVEMMGLHFVNVSARYLLSRIDYRGTSGEARRSIRPLQYSYKGDDK